MENVTLSLYHYVGCPYCHVVERAVSELGVKIERRDIRVDSRWLNELTGATGRKTVPVLRIDRPDGTTTWMPESRDIVRWLRENVPAKS